MNTKSLLASSLLLLCANHIGLAAIPSDKKHNGNGYQQEEKRDRWAEQLETIRQAHGSDASHRFDAETALSQQQKSVFPLSSVKVVSSVIIDIDYAVSNRSSANSFTGNHSSPLELADIRWNLHAIFDPAMSMYFSLDENPQALNADGDPQGFTMEQAYVHFGDHHTSPFSLEIGRNYLPFGKYKHHPVVNSVTQILNQYISTSAHLGVSTKYVFGSLYWFGSKGSLEGTSAPDARSARNFGIEIGTLKVSDEIGYQFTVGLNNNMAEAEHIQDLSPSTTKRVASWAFHGAVNVGHLGFTMDYTIPNRAFDKNDISYDGRGARPQAFSSEVYYSYKLAGMPSTVTAGYQATRQGLFISLPQKRWIASHTIHFNHKVSGILEVKHDADYSSSHFANFNDRNGAAATTNGTGRFNNSVNARVTIHL